MYDETFDPRRYDDGCEEFTASQRLRRAQQKSMRVTHVVFGVAVLSMTMQLLIVWLYAS